ncbi:tripartite tricarboxylate transporter permease [Pelagibius sp.]|uniref:tripartite tricarboxylate transporter permease n=1 Tax=Pelagibius sp. TaxID=1931238 RepID=UPI00260F58CF|nr:tripartite tricarboxylate transporter permease [Pelagibius sp.]
MIEHLPAALTLSASFTVLLALIVGTIAGIIVGALPGLGTVLGLVMALPFTYALDGPTAVALLLALYVSSIYGGSISAILINVPGTPQSAATVFDGYPMAQRGEGALALGWATTASFIGGIFSLVVLILIAPQLAKVALEFGPIETFALVLFALTTIAWVSSGEMLKGLLSACIGLFLAFIGPDDMTGQVRFDFDILFLSGGLAVIPLLIGLFAISEVIYQAATLTDAEMPSVKSGGFKFPSWAAWRPRIVTLLRSCGIGSFIGVLPGTGATAAVFVAYADAKRRSDTPENFGKGEPDGLIASEASNNAVSGGAMVPMLALGIPGDGGTVVMMGALTIHNVIPGVRLFQNQPDVVLSIFLLLLAANIFMLIFGAMGANVFSRLLRIPITLLMPLVLMMSLVGAYAVRSNPVDLVVALGAGLVAFVLRLNSFPLAPIIIGFILGGALEMSLRQGLVMTDQSFLRFFESPIALFLFAITALIVANLILGDRLLRFLPGFSARERK